MFITKYIMQTDVHCPFSKEDKRNVLVRKTGLPHSRVNCTVVIPPGRWTTKPGELERKQNRAQTWLVKNIISKKDKIVPIQATTTTGDKTLVFVAMDEREHELYKLDNNLP